MADPSQKRKSLIGAVILAAVLVVAAATISMAVGISDPAVTGTSPADGATVTTASTTISFTVSDPDLIANGNYYIKVGGSAIVASLQYKGRWETDTCSGAKYWVVTGYDQATISGTASIKDGPQTVEVQAADRLGNTVVTSWTINGAVNPVISDLSPANGATAGITNVISATITDNDQLDPASIILTVDGTVYDSAYYSFDTATGRLNYSVPDPGLATGTHTAALSVRDAAGNQASTTWSFDVQATGQPLTFTDDGKVLDTATPTLTVLVQANSKIDSAQTLMSIDGSRVNAQFTYKGHWDYPMELDPVWVVDSYNEATLTYNAPTIQDGPHKLSVTTRDALNYINTKTWNFTIAQKPQFSGMEPAAGLTLTTQTPAIKVIINDPNGPAIDQASIRMAIDGNEFTPALADSGGTITATYTPGVLTNDAYHNIAVTAADTVGNTNTVSWRIYINTKGEMAVNAKSCGSCHTLNEYDKYVHTEGPLGIGVGHSSPTHFYGNACDHCHGGYKDNTCGYCHGGNIMPPWEDYTWVPPTPDPAMAAGQDCTFCHSLNNGGWVPSPYAADHFYWVQNMVNTGVEPPQPTYPDIPFTLVHDIMPAHRVDKGTCNDCHSVYLTREHNRVSRNGYQITCETCHKSEDPNVKLAIATKNLDCLACHTQANHETVHTDSLDSNCQTCHKSTLTAEHLDNDKTTAKYNYSCDTCHTNTGKEVRRTISAGSLYCAGCHQESKTHNVLFADKVPEDIALYTGYIWTTPMEVSVFSGEPSTPSGYTDGQVVLSNRRTDVSVADAWAFYSQQLTAGGWTVKSGAPAEGASSFAAEFVKGGRAVTVKFYNTQSSDGMGGPVATGYRTEIWYK